MTLQLLLDQRNMSKYHLSKISGVPKTTIMDICADLQPEGLIQYPEERKTPAALRKAEY